MKKIGEGLSCSSNSEAIGEFVFIQSVEDVINLFDSAEGKICLVKDSGTTTLGPILPDLAGVVCTSGSAGSHIAIVSREFEIPCIMSLILTIEDISSLNGTKCKIVTEEDDKGNLYLCD
jgi:signal transduction protein with GAF and PtsI domain